MKSLPLSAVLLTAFGVSAFAGSIGTITSAHPFSLDGHTVSTPGVGCYPLVSGDTITTDSSSAVITLANGKTVVLEPDSTLKITGTASSPVATLVTGSVSKSSTEPIVTLNGSPNHCWGWPPPVSCHHDQ
jgi:hypothetical protein